MIAGMMEEAKQLSTNKIRSKSTPRTLRSSRTPSKELSTNDILQEFIENEDVVGDEDEGDNFTDEDILKFIDERIGSEQNRALSIPAIAFYMDTNLEKGMVDPKIAKGEWNPELENHIARVIAKNPRIKSIDALGGKVGVIGWNRSKKDGRSVFRKNDTLYYDSQGRSDIKRRLGGGQLPPSMFYMPW